MANESATCRVEFERSYNYLRLVAACCKMARTSVKVRKTNWKLLPLVLLQAQEENIRASFALSMHSLVHFTEVTRQLALLITACKCCFSN